MKKILIAADHAGFALKEHLKRKLPQFEWEDLGAFDSARVDYPDFADRVAARINASGGRGVLICGSGQGMAIRANRYADVRAVVVWDIESTRLSRQHNDANVLCLGARFLDAQLGEQIVTTFLETEFEGGRHRQRVDQLSKSPR